MRNLLSSFVLQNRLARASELALLGAYANAEAVLMPRGLLPKSHQELDLLARIKVQLGDYEVASQLWSAASKLGNRSYQEEIDELETWKHAIESRNRMIYRVVFSVILVTLLALIASFLYPKASKAFRDLKRPTTQGISETTTPAPVPYQSIFPVIIPCSVVTPSPFPSPSVEKMKPRKKTLKSDSE